MSQTIVIVDTNIIFSALLSASSRFNEVLFGSPQLAFYICESVIVELFEHKERIVKVSRLPEDEVVSAYYALLRNLNLYKEDWIDRVHRQNAYELCANLDEDDIPAVALTLELKGLLWTGDKILKRGLAANGFTQFFEPK